MYLYLYLPMSNLLCRPLPFSYYFLISIAVFVLCLPISSLDRVCCAGWLLSSLFLCFSLFLYLLFTFPLFLCTVSQCPAWRGCVVLAGCCHFYLPTTQGLIKHLLSIPWLGGSPLFCPVFSNTFYKIGRYKPNTRSTPVWTTP